MRIPKELSVTIIKVAMPNLISTLAPTLWGVKPLIRITKEYISLNYKNLCDEGSGKAVTTAR